MRPAVFSTHKCGVLVPDEVSARTAGSSGYRGCFCARGALTSSLVELTPQQSQPVNLPRGGTGRTLYGRSQANFGSTEGWWESASTHRTSGTAHGSSLSTGSWRQPFYLVLQLHHTQRTRTEQYTPHPRILSGLFSCFFNTADNELKEQSHQQKAHM